MFSGGIDVVLEYCTFPVIINDSLSKRTMKVVHWKSARWTNGVQTLIQMQKTLTTWSHWVQQWWSFWESLTLAMVKAVLPSVWRVHQWVKAFHPSMASKNTKRMVRAVHPLVAGENKERTMLCHYNLNNISGLRLSWASLSELSVSLANPCSRLGLNFLLYFKLNSKLNLSAAHWWYAQWNPPSSHPPDDWPNLKLESSVLSAQLRVTVKLRGVVWMLKVRWVCRATGRGTSSYVFFAVELLQCWSLYRSTVCLEKVHAGQGFKGEDCVEELCVFFVRFLKILKWKI